jgi:hypothetical protein
MNWIKKLTPRLPKQYLMFMAAVVWTFAGGMLLFRGWRMFIFTTDHLLLPLLIGVTGGFIVYLLLFSRISKKHVTRIRNLPIEKPCMFSFFNFRSYLLMALMITAGITLRKSGIVDPHYLSVFYVTMGIPLFISSFRFYYSGIFT